MVKYIRDSEALGLALANIRDLAREANRPTGTELQQTTQTAQAAQDDAAAAKKDAAAALEAALGVEALSETEKARLDDVEASLASAQADFVSLREKQALTVSSENLVVNPFFDYEGRGWGTGRKFVEPPEAFRGHQYAIEMTQAAAGSPNMSIYSNLPLVENRVSCEPGRSYYAEFWAYQTGQMPSTGDGYDCRVYFYDATGEKISGMLGDQSAGTVKYANAPTGQWFKIGGGQVAAPADAATMHVRPLMLFSADTVPNSAIAYIGYVLLKPVEDAVTIADGAVTAGKLAANSVTARTLAVIPDTGAGGLKMDAAGIDIIPGNSLESKTAISMRADTENTIQFAKDGQATFTVTSDGELTAQKISANTAFEYRGEELIDLLNSLPQGVVSRTYMSNSKVISSGAWCELASSTFDIVGGRTYCAFATISYVSSADIPARAGLFAAPKGGNPIKEWILPSRVGASETQVMYMFEFTSTDVGYGKGEGGTCTVGLYGKSNQSGKQIAFHGINTSPYAATMGCHITIHDLGTRFPEIVYQTGTATSSTSTATPTVQTSYQTKTFAPTWVRNWTGSGAQYNYGTMTSNYAFHGQYLAANGSLRSMIGFGSDLTSFCAGGTVTSIKLYVKNAHSYSSSGLNAAIGYHGVSSVPASFTQAGNLTTQFFAKGQGKTITLGSTQAALLKSGAMRGITLHPNTSNIIRYGYFDWKATRLTVTVRK